MLFINDMDSRTECTINTFADNMKLDGAVDFLGKGSHPKAP